MEALCKKEGFENLETLVQRDFEFLSDRIEAKTGVVISLSTMKRLSNGQFSRLPQVATLNAICQYIGYESWQEFKKDKETQKSKENVVPQPISGSSGTRANYVVFAVLLGIVALASGFIASASEAVDLFGWDDNLTIPVLCSVGLFGFLRAFT